MLGLAFDSSSRYFGRYTWPSNLQRLYMANKPDPAEGFKYPQDCEVVILRYTDEGEATYLRYYDRGDDPNDFDDGSDLPDDY